MVLIKANLYVTEKGLFLQARSAGAMPKVPTRLRLWASAGPSRATFFFLFWFPTDFLPVGPGVA